MLFKLLDQNCVNGVLALHVVKYILKKLFSAKWAPNFKLVLLSNNKNSIKITKLLLS
jgi:hypothetical protein